MTEYLTHEITVTGKKYKPGTVFPCTVLIPDADADEFGLYLGHDGRNEADERALMRLADEGRAPYCVCIGVAPGTLPVGGGERGMRADDYDLFDREYADFLIRELIPTVTEKYGFRISASPDLHMISGGSSGGMSAFNVAWTYPEYFHRVYMSSPSFLSMGRGNEIPILIRKCETRPFRVYEEYSENEPDEYFGSSLCAAMEAERALKFAGYDFRCSYFPGEGHCSRRLNENEAYERLTWLWKDYDTIPVRAPRNSPRVSAVVPGGSVWEKTDAFPAKAGVTHSVLSADHAMIYSGGEDEDVLTGAPTGRADERYCHGMLHTLPRVSPKGAIDLALDEDDRLYVLTAIGVQCVRSFGLIDVILDLPDDSRPLQIAFGDDERDLLYLRTEKGAYRRRMRARGAENEASQPKHTNYGD